MNHRNSNVFSNLSRQEEVDSFCQKFALVQREIQKRIIGQDKVIENVLIGLFADGHVLLEGVPGLGKTKLVQTLSETLGLKHKRIQFTPDMMPSDITGVRLLVDDSHSESGQNRFEFEPGPIFSQIVLADEINRATPRTQSALLEAMQERTVSVSNISYPLERPFCVLATQNPLEMDGTYRLPEAQLDRFFFKLILNLPTADHLLQIMHQTTVKETEQLQQKLSSEQISWMQKLVLDVQVPDSVANYIVQLVRATHPNHPSSHDYARQYVKLGAGVRGMQAITLAAKVKALLDARLNIDFEDLDQIIFPALRHRILLNFDAQAQGITTDIIIQEILVKKKIEI